MSWTLKSKIKIKIKKRYHKSCKDPKFKIYEMNMWESNVLYQRHRFYEGELL